MLTLPPSVRIFAAVEPVDARKSFDGLSAVVRDGLGGDPCRVTCSSSSTGEVTCADPILGSHGFVVMRKRLEAGTFRLVRSADGNKSHVEIDAAELGLMLEGIDLGTVKRRKRFKWSDSQQWRKNQQPRNDYNCVVRGTCDCTSRFVAIEVQEQTEALCRRRAVAGSAGPAVRWN